MSLRDRIKSEIKARATSMARRQEQAAEQPAGRQERVEVYREQLVQNERDQRAEIDDGRLQAARAERVATMGAPVKARLDPVDIPHPFGDDDRDPFDAADDDDQPTMEDLVLGGSNESNDDGGWF